MRVAECIKEELEKEREDNDYILLISLGKKWRELGQQLEKSLLRVRDENLIG